MIIRILILILLTIATIASGSSSSSSSSIRKWEPKKNDRKLLNYKQLKLSLNFKSAAV